MSAISSYQERPPKPAAIPAPPAEKPVAPAAPLPKLDMPQAARLPGPPSPSSSMLIKPESRLAPRGALRGPDYPRLKSRGWSSEFSKVDSEGITRGFSSVRFQAPELKPAAAVVPPSRPQAKKGPARGSDESVPSTIYPDLTPEEVFWTRDRLLRVGGASLLALLGVLYIARTAFPGKKAGEAP